LLDLESGRLLFSIIPRKGNGEVRWGGGPYALIFLCAGVLQKVRTYDRVRAASAYNTDTNFGVRKERIIFTTVSKKNRPTN
jgi:hypothetical protein